MVNEKLIDVGGGKLVGFRASALLPRLYRVRFGRDIIRDLNALQKNFQKAAKAQALPEPGPEATEEERAAHAAAVQEAQLGMMDLTVFENVAYLMAKQYDPTIPDTVELWLDGFDIFSIYLILPQILELWNLSQQTTSIPKKKFELP